ncbi:MAG: DUF1932 domain-containing protein [Pseudomonadota bacterium]|nr:DUF1932 domain-containing protein [Pseudomonadota bacterium]
MQTRICFLGFGEAAQRFSGASTWRANTRAYDIKTDFAESRQEKLNDFEHARVQGCSSLPDAVADQDAILSLVTADQSGIACEKASKHISAGAFYFDMNSVAPQQKQQSCRQVSARAANYVDVAIMAPVGKSGLDAPLLISGPQADRGRNILNDIGFSNLTIVGEEVGQAASIKMIRSIMIKGIEALTAETLMAAHQQGVTDHVLDSLGGDWATRADYNLERMITHGQRRAAEMEEVCLTLEALKISPIMSKGTETLQRELSRLAINPGRSTLAQKLEALSELREGNKA